MPRSFPEDGSVSAARSGEFLLKIPYVQKLRLLVLDTSIKKKEKAVSLGLNDDRHGLPKQAHEILLPILGMIA